MIIVKHKEIFHTVQYICKSCSIVSQYVVGSKPFVWDQLIRDIIKYRTNLFGHNKRWDHRKMGPPKGGRFFIFNQPKMVPSSRFHCNIFIEIQIESLHG